MDARYFNPSISEAIKQAEAKGFEVIRSSPTTLLLDLDSVKQMAQFKFMYVPFLEAYQPDGELEQWTSKGGNKHIVLHLKTPLSATLRVALETILGSDPKRSLFALERLQVGVLEPGLLFKPRGFNVAKAT